MEIPATHFKEHLPLPFRQQLTRLRRLLHILKRLAIIIRPLCRLHRLRPLLHLRQRLQTARHPYRICRLLRMVNPLQQRGIELLHHLRPLHLPLLNRIQPCLHIGRKIYLKQIGLISTLQLLLRPLHQPHQLSTQRRWNQRSLLLLHILPLIQLRHNRRIRTRATHTILLQRFDQRRL